MYNNANVSSFIAFSFTLLYSSIAILKEKHCKNYFCTRLYYVLFAIVVAVLFGKSGKNSGLLYFSCVSFL
mgnify:FL=1